VCPLQVFPHGRTRSWFFSHYACRLICGGLGTLIGLGVMLAGVTSPVLVIFGALTSVIVALACFHVVVLPLFLSW
jgi:hypothetical protein